MDNLPEQANFNAVTRGRMHAPPSHTGLFSSSHAFMPNRNLGGRPPKYNEPSRPITVTLPESTLHQLEMIDEDRGMAIVKLARSSFVNGVPPPLVEVVKVGSSNGLVIVGRSSTLTQIPYLHLVEVAPGRFLLAIEQGHDFRSLELTVQDLLEEDSPINEIERTLIAELLTCIRQLRRNERVSPAEILLVHLDKHAPQRHPALSSVAASPEFSAK
jgi:hypothetical protein